MCKSFYELIRIAIGTQSELSSVPSAEEWVEIFALAEKQSLVGVCFAGVQKLQTSDIYDDTTPEERNLYWKMPEELYLTWMSTAARIQQRNEVLNGHCSQLQKKISTDGYRNSILKGQGIGALYGDLSTYRQPGDIDVWIDADMRSARRYAENKCGEKCRFDYKHLHWPVIGDTKVELHYRVEALKDIFRNSKLQGYWQQNNGELDSGCVLLEGGLRVSCPSVRLNLFFILLHIYRHFFEGGIGLRQVMDYFFLLKCEDVNTAMRQSAMADLENFGMGRFAHGLMWVIKDIFGAEDEILLCSPSEKEGRVIMEEIIQGGNFGHHDNRIARIGSSRRMRYLTHNLQHNWHLLRYYPREVVSMPLWLAWHWCWKRFVLLKGK